MITQKLKEQILKIKKSTVSGGRFYLQDLILSTKTLFKPGTSYEYTVDTEKNVLEIKPSSSGEKIVAKRTLKDDQEISIIDIRNNKTKEALEDCDYQIVTITEDRIIVTGHKNTASSVKETCKETLFSKLRSITFCGGGGISAHHAKEAGFSEDYILEFNPLKGESQWSRYADVAEINHPDSIIINVPIEEFKADMIPDMPSIWFATIPCNEYSQLNINAKKEDSTSDDKTHSMHLGLHLVRLFSELPPEKRPECVFIENVPGFKNVMGKSLELFFKDNGYFVSSAIMESADYGSLMRRKRYYMVANIYEEFEFPAPTGKNEIPFMQQPWFNLDAIEWHTPETAPSIKYMLDRQQKKGNAVINIKAINPETDCVSYAIPKEYRISKPEGQIKHPYKEDTYAIFPTEYLKQLFNLPSDFYLGSSATMERECIGQSVDGKTIKLLFDKLSVFLKDKREIMQNSFSPTLIQATLF